MLIFTVWAVSLRRRRKRERAENVSDEVMAEKFPKLKKNQILKYRKHRYGKLYYLSLKVLMLPTPWR